FFLKQRPKKVPPPSALKIKLRPRPKSSQHHTVVLAGVPEPDPRRDGGEEAGLGSAPLFFNGSHIPSAPRGGWTRARPQVIQALVTSTIDNKHKKTDGPFVPGICGPRLSSVPSAKGKRKTSQGR
ncbi:unnamed protein product, partial [Ectocarpus sp. 12 AP-2014]